VVLDRRIFNSPIPFPKAKFITIKIFAFWFAKGQIFGGGKICPFASASQALNARGSAYPTPKRYFRVLKAG
jgi:hypothetical protein